MVQPDQEQKDLQESFERNEWQSIPARELEIDRYREYFPALELICP